MRLLKSVSLGLFQKGCLALQQTRLHCLWRTAQPGSRSHTLQWEHTTGSKGSFSLARICSLLASAVSRKRGTSFACSRVSSLQHNMLSFQHTESSRCCSSSSKKEGNSRFGTCNENILADVSQTPQWGHWTIGREVPEWRRPGKSGKCLLCARCCVLSVRRYLGVQCCWSYLS